MVEIDQFPLVGERGPCHLHHVTINEHKRTHNACGPVSSHNGVFDRCVTAGSRGEPCPLGERVSAGSGGRHRVGGHLCDHHILSQLAQRRQILARHV